MPSPSATNRDNLGIMLLAEKLNSTGSRTVRIRRSKLAAKLLQAMVEVTLLSGAFVLAYLLRFDFNLPSGEVVKMVSQAVFVVGFQILALRAFWLS